MDTDYKALPEIVRRNFAKAEEAASQREGAAQPLRRAEARDAKRSGAGRHK